MPLARLLALGAVVLTACGSSSSKSGAAAGSGSAVGSAAVADDAPLPPIGVDAIKRFNYVYGDGEDAFAKASAAARPRDKAKAPDWVAARSNAEAALAKDPDHAGAHRLLAAALVQLGEPDGAAAHLEAALAQDWLGFGAGLHDDARLTTYFDSPAGQRLQARSARLEAATLAIARTGPLLLGRRAPFKWPSKPGAQSASTRGEVYALDVASKRFVRITHTDHQVVGMLRSPDGKELVVVGYDKLDVPGKEAAATQPPLLASAWLETYETDTFRRVGVRTRLGATRQLAIQYAAGDQLLVRRAAAAGRWAVATPSTLESVDRGAGKLVATAATGVGPTLTITADEAVLVAAVDPTIQASWTEDASGAGAWTSVLSIGRGAPIALPDAAHASRAGLRLAPSGALIALPTRGDACTPGAPAPPLYVGDVSTGKVRHVLSAASRLTSRWLDDARLIYEDGDGGLRVWDATTSREVARFTERGGLALDGLSASIAPPCKAAPPAPETLGTAINADAPPSADDETDGAIPDDELPALDQPTE